MSDITLAQIQHEKRLLLGIQVAKKGEHERAKDLLENVLRQDPHNELAWIWWASLAQNKKELRTYLTKIMEINPHNTEAETAYNDLVGVLEDVQIDWDAMSRQAKTRFKSQENEDYRRKLFGKAPKERKPMKPQLVLLNLLILIFGSYAVASIYFPAISPANILRNILPQTGDANVTFVRAYQVEDAAELEASDSEYAQGPVQPFLIGDTEPPPSTEEQWVVKVTIAHDSTDEAYVDGWDLVLPNGRVLEADRDQRHTYRVTRPRETSSFTTTRMLTLPAGTPYIIIRAHDTDGGYGGQEVRVDLTDTAASSDLYEVIR